MAEKMPGGYNGKILRVNLTEQKIATEELTPQFCRKYLGGAGFIAYYLWKELKPGTDPLGPDNKLIFAVGPLTGVSLSGSGRNCVGAKSPLTGGIAKSEVGEFWGAEFKRASYDALIIEGKAAKPVYLWLHDGEASIIDASHLWGQNTKEAQAAIRDELGDNRVRVAGIGPAGEKQVRFACIMNGLFDAAGRGGLGAVMGSKNLKAVAVRGHHPPPVVNPDGVKALRDWMLSHMQLMRDFTEFGTGAAMEPMEAIGNLPVRNFRDGLFPPTAQTNAKVLKNTFGVGMDSCFGCAVRCKKAVEIPEGPNVVDRAYGGPEYEALASMGSNCGVSDLTAIVKGNELCNAYSLDAISTGVVVSFAMECFENGLLTTKDTGGLELKFGNGDAMLKLIELIARREGIGDLLAEGTLRASRKIGKNAEQFALQVKGLEPGMHEPRVKHALGLGFMVNPHGADHCCNLHDTAYETEGQYSELRPLGIVEPIPLNDIGPRKVALFRFIQAKRIMFDSLVMCLFLPYRFDQMVNVLAAVTGWDTGIVEQLTVAERMLTLARLFNIREGLSASDDVLPTRFFQPKTDGVLADKPLDPAQMEKAKQYYYQLMGWDKVTGVPTPEKLEELGIA
ncbi:MAG: aldehyde ferredoxin oxidoreductase family protein [Chloroflexota bacterium]